MRTVLIIGQKPDAHIELVTRKLRKREASVIFFDVLSPERNLVNIHIGRNDTEAYLEKGKFTFKLSDINSVWWRVKPITPSGRRNRSLWTEFVLREWRSLFESLDAYMPHSKWVNPRISELRARNKPFQLAIARRLGFMIPDTLISNSPHSAKQFISKNPIESIFKVLTWYMDDTNAIFTSDIGPGNLQNKNYSLRLSPGIFQERIEKAFELRVTVIGQQIFASKIDSQLRKTSELDWRRDQFRVPYTKYDLPNEITHKIRKMNRLLGLEFSAYDFVVSKEGEHCFLEVNPGGQWLWIEKRLGLPISSTMADFLLT